MSQQLLSLCMIIKDEAQQLPSFIATHRKLFDEWVIVDTGSTDDSLAIIESEGLPVYQWKWTSDFAAARNYALSLCKGKWIAAFDADERLAKKDQEALRTLFGSTDADAFTVSIKNYVVEDENFAKDPSQVIDYIPPDGSYLQLAESQDQDYGYKCTELIRFFRNNRGFSWRSPVHEVLDCYDPTITPHIQALDSISLHHLGTLDLEGKVERKDALYAEMARKLYRESSPDDSPKKLYETAKFVNEPEVKLRLLQQARAKAPRDPHIIKEMINTLVGEDQAERALELSDSLLAIEPNKLESYMGKVHCLLQKGAVEEAWTFLKSHYRQFQSEPMYLYHLALLAAQGQRVKQALSYSRRAAEKAPSVRFIQEFYSKIKTLTESVEKK